MEELKNFINSHMQVIAWPSKGKKKEAVINYLAEKIEFGKSYSESEINELLNKYHTFNDPALLRREMFERKVLDRDINGNKYWKL